MSLVTNILLLGMAWALASCTDSGFSGAGKTTGSGKGNGSAEGEGGGGEGAGGGSGSNTGNGGSGGAGGDGNESFEVARTSSKLDMIWVIDNSGSMDNEAAAVEQNFKAFITTMAAKADFNFALISSKKQPTGVDLGTIITGPNLRQYEYKVDSEDALVNIAAMSCPQQANPGTGKIIVCGQDFSGHARVDEVNESQIYDQSGKLREFYRADAQKVFVIVTDDNASVVDDKNFLTLVKDHINPQPYIFAFAAKSTSKCDIAKPGAAYEALATTTKGKVFDICAPDWKVSFDELIVDVTEIIFNKFTLKKTPNKIISVTVDGKQLAASDYHMEGNVLVVKKEVLSSGAKTIVVKYQ